MQKLKIPTFEAGDNIYVPIQEVKLYEWDLSENVYKSRMQETVKNGTLIKDHQKNLEFLKNGPIMLEELRDYCERPDESIRFVQRPGTELEKLFDMIRDEPYNVSLLEAAACVLRTRLILNPVFNPESSPKLGEGQDAAVFRGTLKELNKLVQDRKNDIKPFIVKTLGKITDSNEQNTRSKANLLNEVLSALYITNKLRKNIPTFMYVYTAFYEKRYHNGKLFEGPERVLYTLVESIYGISLYEWLKENINSNWENNNNFRGIIYEIIAQVILALQMLRERDKYASHGDLHTNNIYIQNLDKEYKIKFLVGGGAVYVTTKYLVRILDLGQMTGQISLQGGGKFLLGSNTAFLRLQQGIPNTLFDLTFFLGTLSGLIFKLTSQKLLNNNALSPVSAIGIECLAQIAAPQNWMENKSNPGLLDLNRFDSWEKSFFFSPIAKNIDLLKFFVNSLHEMSKVNYKFKLNVKPKIQIDNIQYMNESSKVSYGISSDAPLFSCASNICSVPNPAIKGKNNK